MSLLVARGLSAGPPGAAKAVLRDLTLELEAGEWLALSGPNGGGKSTLAMVLAGLWPASQGSVEFEGQVLGTRAGAHVRANTAVIFQDPSSQFITDTVADELLYAARNLGRENEARPTLERWIAAFDLEGDLECDPRTLSAGRQQLVLLGSALAARPRLLIADEPAAHLDARMRGLVLAHVREEVSQGLAVVWVTQDAEERAAADRTLWIGGAHEQRAHVASSVSVIDAAPALTLSVATCGDDAGPRLRNSEPFELIVRARGVTALTGPNGCGKSVLLHAAVGVIEMRQCRVVWNIAPAAPPILASQYPDQQIFEEKVEDELIFAAVSRGMTRGAAIAAATEALERLGLPAPEFMQKRCWWLSGGEKRLVSTLAALIAPASLVALDEPTAGLDDERRHALQVLVNERSSRNAVLVASQDLGWIGPWGAISLGKPGHGLSSLPSISKKTD